MGTDTLLRPYQERIAAKMHQETALGVFADMGTGKTLITLKALERIGGITLLVAPIRVCETVWRQEAAKWNSPLNFALLRGTPKERLESLGSNADVFLINPDLLPWLFRQKKLPEFTTLVIDESSMFKSPSTQRFKILKKHLKLFQRKYLLTGTPSPNSLLDLWPQIFLLDQGQRLGTAFGRFRETYFDSDYMGFKWSPKKGSSRKIEQLVQNIVERLDAKDYLTLPEMLENDIIVKLSDKELTAYNKFKKDMVLSLQGEELSALSAVALYTKLSQLANGFIYDEEKNAHTFHLNKIQALSELIEELDEPTIVTYKYLHELKEIKKALPQAIAFNEGEFNNNMTKWNKGLIPVLLLHPASSGHGLNLQEGGRHIVWFSPIPSLEQYLQTNKRLHRSGQTKPVFVHRLIAESTVDEQVIEVLRQKDHTQTTFLDAMKKILST